MKVPAKVTVECEVHAEVDLADLIAEFESQTEGADHWTAWGGTISTLVQLVERMPASAIGSMSMRTRRLVRDRMVSAATRLFETDQPSDPGRDRIKADLIRMRKYVMYHNVGIGECVAWNRLKKEFGIGNDSAEDDAWLKAYESRMANAPK